VPATAAASTPWTPEKLLAMSRHEVKSFFWEQVCEVVEQAKGSSGNKKIRCRLCPYQAMGSSKAYAHITKTTDFVHKLGRVAVGILSPSAAVAKPAVLAPQFGTLDAFVFRTSEPETMMREALVDWCVSSGCSFSGIHSMGSLFDAVGDIARKHPGVRLSEVLTKRHALTTATDKVTEQSHASAISKMRAASKGRKLTLVEDGKTLNNLTVSVKGVEACGSIFYPIAVDTSMAEQKTAARLKDDMLDALRREGLEAEVASVCMDGASACVAAGHALEKSAFLHWFRCQSHAFSLGLVWVFRHVPYLADLILSVELVLSFISSSRRLQAELKSLPGGGAILLLISTRFCYHGAALVTLLKRKAALQSLVHSNTGVYVEVLAGFTGKDREKKRAQGNKVRELLRSSLFWSQVEFALAVCAPLTRAVRFVDAAQTSSGWIRRLWSLQADSLKASIGGAAFDTVPVAIKTRIVEVVGQAFTTHCAPNFDAPHMLNPFNRQSIEDLMTSSELADVEEYAEMEANTLKFAERCYMRELYVKALRDRIEFDAPAARLAVATKVDEFKMDLVTFLRSPEQYSLRENESPEGFWEAATPFPSLAFVARIALSASSCSSNMERNHKLLSAIWTKCRNRLLLSRVLRLMQGAIVKRGKLSSFRGLAVTPASFSRMNTFTDAEDLDATHFDEMVETAKVAAATDAALELLAGEMADMSIVVEQDEATETLPLPIELESPSETELSELRDKASALCDKAFDASSAPPLPLALPTVPLAEIERTPASESDKRRSRSGRVVGSLAAYNRCIAALNAPDAVPVP